MRNVLAFLRFACVAVLLAAVACVPAITSSESSGKTSQDVVTGSIATRSSSSTTDNVYDGYGSEVMLQGFGWSSYSGSSGSTWYQVMTNNASVIGTYFDWVWFPPPSDAASNEGYLPRELNDLDSNYGTESQLRAAISAISPAKAIADIVINHRVGTTNWADFTNPTWGTDAICSDDEYFSSGNPGASVSLKGAADTGSGYSAARDLDHTNSTVNSGIKNWMNNVLKDVGFVGWRYDYVKGYSGWYVGDYNAATDAEFSVGELWEDGTPQDNMNTWVNATNHDDGKSLVFDFTTKNMLNSAFGWFSSSDYSNYNNYPNLSVLKSSYGTPSGYIGWHPENSVTFVDNHDTGSSQETWELRGDKVYLAYVYILTHPGMPCVQWEHFFDWGSSLQTHIEELINIRKTYGITMTSTVDIELADSNQYAAIIDDKIAVKIGTASTYSPGTGWTIIKSGSDYCIWAKDDADDDDDDTSLRTVVYMYKETSVGQDIYIRGGHDSGLVPSVYDSTSEAITYNNTLNSTTASVKASDTTLDWSSNSALDWTCPIGTSGQPLYSEAGYGQDEENTFGSHWWKFDVNMTGTLGDWFEFKAVMVQNSTSTWESDISQSSTPYSTINHWGKKGYITKVVFSSSWVEFVDLE